MTTAAEGDHDLPRSLLLAPLLESLPDISLGMTTAAEGDAPLSLLLRLLDLPDLLRAEAGVTLVRFSDRPETLFRHCESEE